MMRDAWIGLGVMTESGEPLGWVRKIIYSAEDRKPVSLVIVTMPILWLPEIVTGSYLLPVSEIFYRSTNYLIVFERTEAKLVCKTVGLLERIGLNGRPPWVRSEEQLYPCAIYPDDRDDGTGLSPVPRSPKPNPNHNFDEVNLPPN